MRAVICTDAGGIDVLEVQEVPDPQAGDGEVLLDVTASAVNRADLLQRPGVIAEVGPGVEGWQVGDEVCALLAGGGYAEKVAVPAGQLLPVPEGTPLDVAAALPEVTCTVWSNVFMVAGLQPEESVLVHGGAGGIGTMAIQLAKVAGSRVFTTAGAPAKLKLCRELGADVVISYRDEDFVEVVKSQTDGAGVDVILDNMGAAYLDRNLDALATNGRLAIIGMQGGTKGELNIGKLLSRRGAITATSLRARPVEEKASIVASVREHVWPLLTDALVRPVVHTKVPLDDVREAHRMVEEGEHVGKVLLTT
jgi:putative PIG3 family NAD(P)H quinone oxidoreductase